MSYGNGALAAPRSLARSLRLRIRRPLATFAAAAALVALVAVPVTQAVGTTTATASPSCDGGPRGMSGRWTCTFDDEFNGTSLNTNLWQPELTANTGYMTGADCYVNNPNTISVSGGHLNLSVLKVPMFQCDGLDFSQYEIGMVTTASLFTQTYGAFEVNAKLPAATVQGLQETFWLYPQNLTYGAWPASGEIDFAEFYSKYPGYEVPYVHYNSTASDPDAYGVCNVDQSQFNTYGLDRTPTSLTMFVNGTPCLTDSWLHGPAPFNQPFFIALTQALGVNGDAVTVSTPFPDTTQINWVRAWAPAS